MLDACKQEDLELPILEVRDVKKVSLVLVTGDRGLCGGYNSAVIKQTTKRISKLKEQGIEVTTSAFQSAPMRVAICSTHVFLQSPSFPPRAWQTQLILVGRKGEQWFIRRPTPVAATFVLGNIPQPSVGSELANLLVAQFLTKEVDACEIIYTRFNNLISYDPSIRTLLPLTLSGIESEEDDVFKVTTKDGKMVLQKQAPVAAGPVAAPDYIFEDEPTEILQTMLTLYFSATIMRCMQVRVAYDGVSRPDCFVAVVDPMLPPPYRSRWRRSWPRV